MRVILRLTAAWVVTVVAAEVSYEELCGYDHWCTNLKAEDGSFIAPKPGLLPMLATLGPTVRDVAAKLKVDPVAVAGAIAAGNSLTSTIDDDSLRFLERIEVLPIANEISKLVRGKSFSLGLGQIKVETAVEAEPLLARIEGRATRTPGEVREALLQPVENIKYVAAIERGCQDAYQRRGMNVAGDAGVLASLYNLGGCPRRAERAAEVGRAPRVNFFGFFVNRYRADIARAVGAEGAPVLAATVARRLKDGVPLAAAPPGCDATPSPPGAVGRGEYEVLAPGVDCDLKDWSLIKTEIGATGWISNHDLGAHAEDFLKSATATCDPAVGARCLARVTSRLGPLALGTNGDGLLNVRLTGGPAAPDQPRVTQFRPGACALSWIDHATDESALADEARRDCDPIFDVAPRARRAWAAAAPGVSLGKLPALCRALLVVRKARATGAAVPPGDEVASLLAPDLTTDAEFDAVLSDAIAAATTDRPACTYDPRATAKSLAALADEPCVEAIFAPDVWLVERLATRPGRAAFKPFDEDDRMAIKVKDGCSRVKAADAAAGTTGAGR